MKRIKSNHFKSIRIYILMISALIIWTLASAHAADRDPASTSSAVIEVYSPTGVLFSKYSLSMQKNLWGLKAEYQSKSAETRMTANTAFSVQSQIFDLSMRDPKKNQKCKMVGKIKTSIGDSLLCEEDARSIGKFKNLIVEMNKILAKRTPKASR